MKYFTRLNLYKAANVVFNPMTMNATSYNWWSFVIQYKGKIIFNNYRYSVTTAKHQAKVRKLLNDLGIKIDLEIETSYSLDNLNAFENAKKLCLSKAAELEALTKLPKTRKAKNAERLVQSAAFIKQAKKIEKVLQ